MNSKQSVRKWAISKRKELDMNVISSVLADKLTKMEEYKKAKNIMIFYPLKNEVDLRILLKDKTKKFYLPKINGENLLCCPYEEDGETCMSCFNTCEPISEPCSKSCIDVVIVPALAVDINGFRIGYGKGFYDRFLKNYAGLKVVCIPSKLIVKTVFPEKHDIRMDFVITELG